MQKLWDTYRGYEPSGSCGIHAKSIGHVLGEYEGYERNPIVVTIHEFPEKLVQLTEEEQRARGLTSGDNMEPRQEFHIRARSKPIQLHENPEVQTLIRVIIKVRQKKMKGQKVKAAHKHSNLIIIDSKEKKIYRFEPLDSFKFNDQVNDSLEVYFKAALPDFEYSEIDIHPQKLGQQKDHTCHVTSAAYVIKAGVMYVLDMDIAFPSEDDSERFASALHHWRDWGSEKHHRGITDRAPGDREYAINWPWDRPRREVIVEEPGRGYRDRRYYGYGDHRDWDRRRHGGGWGRDREVIVEEPGRFYGYGQQADKSAGTSWASHEGNLGASVKLEKTPSAREGVTIKRENGDGQEYGLWPLLGVAAIGAGVGYLVARNSQPRTVIVEREYAYRRGGGYGVGLGAGLVGGALVGGALAGGYYDPYLYGPGYGAPYAYGPGFYGDYYGGGWRGGGGRWGGRGGGRGGGHGGGRGGRR